MKTIANIGKQSTDDIYYVSAADVADKIIDRMWRGLDPLLFSSSDLDLIPVGSILNAHQRRNLN
jgi:hypothetical protein